MKHQVVCCSLRAGCAAFDVIKKKVKRLMLYDMRPNNFITCFEYVNFKHLHKSKFVAALLCFARARDDAFIAFMAGRASFMAFLAGRAAALVVFIMLEPK